MSSYQRILVAGVIFGLEYVCSSIIYAFIFYSFIHSFIHSCMLCMHASYEYWGNFFHIYGDHAGMI